MQEIFSSFSSKLDVKLMEHFSLVLSGPKKGQISYIQNNEKISEVQCDVLSLLVTTILLSIDADFENDMKKMSHFYRDIQNYCQIQK